MSYKLLIAPTIILLVSLLIHQNDIVAKISVMQASMPAHITGSLLASQYNLNPKLCTLMVGIGIMASFLTSAM